MALDLKSLTSHWKPGQDQLLFLLLQMESLEISQKVCWCQAAIWLVRAGCHFSPAGHVSTASTLNS